MRDSQVLGTGLHLILMIIAQVGASGSLSRSQCLPLRFFGRVLHPTCTGALVFMGLIDPSGRLTGKPISFVSAEASGGRKEKINLVDRQQK